MAQLSIEERVKRVESCVGSHPDFPKSGILFRDVFPIMRNPKVFEDLISLLVEHIQATSPQVELIIGLDARGFIFGPLMAQKLGIGFVPVRKAGKLPGECVHTSYALEYGTDKFEVQKEAIKKGQKVVIVDDLLATGGTMSAAYKLMELLEAKVLDCMVVIELVDLNGRSKVPAPLFSLLKYEGE